LVLAVCSVVAVMAASERVDAPLEEAPYAPFDVSAPPVPWPSGVVRPPQPSTNAAQTSAPGPNRVLPAIRLIV
jgi:hypothetical protein